jgi:hypothetical protein
MFDTHIVDSNDCCAKNNISKWSSKQRVYVFFWFLLSPTSIDKGRGVLLFAFDFSSQRRVVFYSLALVGRLVANCLVTQLGPCSWYSCREIRMFLRRSLSVAIRQPPCHVDVMGLCLSFSIFLSLC